MWFMRRRYDVFHPNNTSSSVARGRVVGQLPKHFFEMLPIVQYGCIGGGAIRLGKARASSELEDWRLVEAGTCSELKI